MRWSKYFIPTSREVPAEATAPSHRLMLRAGLIRQLAAGVYTYLPLGLKALRKVENIVREEMNAAGAVELLMPAMQPIELWQETGRDKTLGSTLIRLPDQPWRKGTVLGPTHEEVITDIARAYIHSYKNLPINLYQIQTKFRDEQRPKSGVLRTREFIMKDAYSFDADWDGLNRSYELMYRAYCRIFARCGLPFLAVEAESGPIGGDVSHEFMVPTDAGEDVLVRCESCGYAANLERAECAPLEAQPAPDPLVELREVHTPDKRTIEEVCEFLGRRPEQMIKTLIYRTVEGDVVVALVRGDHEVNAAKLARAVGSAGVDLADPQTIQQITGADVGFAGPHGLSDKGVTLVVDHAVAVMHDAASGANRTDYHVVGLEPGRDFPLANVADIRNATEQDRCARCGGRLRFEKCIEVGHVFKLGTKYSEAMKAYFLDEKGQSRPFIMGCYGIGINRIVAAAIEAHHDEAGIIWPITIAPFEALVVCLDQKDETVVAAAERIYRSLQEAGVDVLYDDRQMRAGPKFVDADLIGIPLRVTVGKRSVSEGKAELKWRDSEEVRQVDLAEAAEVAARQIHERLEQMNNPPDVQ